jgi:hypothetical protein
MRWGGMWWTWSRWKSVFLVGDWFHSQLLVRLPPMRANDGHVTYYLSCIEVFGVPYNYTRDFWIPLISYVEPSGLVRAIWILQTLALQHSSVVKPYKWGKKYNHTLKEHLQCGRTKSPANEQLNFQSLAGTDVLTCSERPMACRPLQSVVCAAKSNESLCVQSQVRCLSDLRDWRLRRHQITCLQLILMPDSSRLCASLWILERGDKMLV